MLIRRKSPLDRISQHNDDLGISEILLDNGNTSLVKIECIRAGLANDRIVFRAFKKLCVPIIILNIPRLDFMVAGAIEGKWIYLAREKPGLLEFTHKYLRMLLQVFMQ